MSRVNVVQKSLKPVKCSRCGNTVPKGSSYRHTKQRYGGKQIHCMEQACRFRPSDLSSAKTALIEDAIEDAEIAIAEAGSYEEIKAALEECGSVASDVAGEYQDASGNWAGGQNEQFDEKADACDSFADELEGWEYSGETDDEAIEAIVAAFLETTPNASDDDKQKAWEDELQAMRDEAYKKLAEFEVP